MAIIVTQYCIRQKSYKSSCQLCIESCPTNAIQLYKRAITINKANCIQCGRCVITCPVNAIEGPLPKRYIQDYILYSDSSHEPTIKELLLYYTIGISIIRLSPTHSHWLNTLNQTNNILKKSTNTVFTIENYSEQDNKISLKRRMLLGLNSLKTAVTYYSIKKEILIQAYSHYQFFSISLDISHCSLCQICEKLCPSHCFQITETTLFITTAKCIGCYLCQDSCPEQVLTINNWIDKCRLIVYPINQYNCQQCQQTFSALKELHICPACHLRNTLKIPQSISTLQHSLFKNKTL